MLKHLSAMLPVPVAQPYATENQVQRGCFRDVVKSYKVVVITVTLPYVSCYTTP